MPAPVASYELPPASLRRWTAERKSIVVRAIREGILTVPEAMERYNLSTEELLQWINLYKNYGGHALKVGLIKKYRPFMGKKLLLLGLLTVAGCEGSCPLTDPTCRDDEAIILVWCGPKTKPTDEQW